MKVSNLMRLLDLYKKHLTTEEMIKRRTISQKASLGIMKLNFAELRVHRNIILRKIQEAQRV